MLYQLPRRPTEWQLILVYLNCILVRSELPSSTEHHFCFIWTSVGLAFISIFFSSGYFKGGKKITRAASCCPRRSTGGIWGMQSRIKIPVAAGCLSAGAQPSWSTAALWVKPPDGWGWSIAGKQSALLQHDGKSDGKELQNVKSSILIIWIFFFNVSR